MSALSETDPNVSLCSRIRRHPPRSSLNHQAREAKRLRAKNDDQGAISSPCEQNKVADGKASFVEIPVSTPLKEVVPDLRKPVRPYASSVNVTDHPPQDQLTTSRVELDLLSEEPAKAVVGQDGAVSIGQEMVKSDKLTKPAVSDDHERKALFQEDIGSIIDVQQILQHPLNQWLLLHPTVGPEHFEWIHQGLGAAAVEEVYDHPNLQEFLELAINFGPEISNANVRMHDVDEPKDLETGVIHGMSIPKNDHATTGVSIPGLTFNNEEEAEWELMVKEACKTPPADLDLETLLMENENADTILICHEYACHLTADELAEVIVLGEGDLIRMLDIICEMYE